MPLWKRSVIKDVDYQFPSGLAKLILNKEEVLIESGYGFSNLMELLEASEIKDLFDKDLIYTLDNSKVILEFYTVEDWPGPEIAPEDEVNFDVPSTIDKVLEILSEENKEALYPTDMKDAIIGVVERFGMSPLVLLDKVKCIDILVGQGMSYEDAVEYFEFNTIGAWMGEGTPCFATLNENYIS